MNGDVIVYIQHLCSENSNSRESMHLCAHLSDGMVNVFVRSEIILPQCNTVCILLLICSKSQPHDDPHGVETRSCMNTL